MAETLNPALRDRLQEERDRLHDQLRQMGVGPGGRLDFDDGFADSGQVTAERGEVEALGGTLLDTLREIEDALSKFDAGTYGRCESCGNQIAEARLEAMPAAPLCINCASRGR
ncbi:MAG TPA: TraR/DksA C4-type zinc finger protein [Acidimicrobiia bacterium]|jgi:DnaK suppressor protein|nr:TraR/DksA C4-type zinc finger protein [Acidimicrobiia bacterium]